MEGIERLARILLSGSLIPLAALSAYNMSRYVDGAPATISQNGSALGVIAIIASVFVISRVASPYRWSERAGLSLALSAAYFLLTWVKFGDPANSVDAAPHLVWYGTCVAVFTPAVVLIVASEWAWDSFRARRADFYAPKKSYPAPKKG